MQDEPETLAGWDQAYREPQPETEADVAGDDGGLEAAEAVEAFQARGVKQGKKFDEQCRLVLEGLGFEVSDRPFTVPDLGVEFDAEIRSKAGTTYWCEFKGSWHGNRPGLRRTDTVKKALADAFIAHAAGEYPPTIFLTTHMPPEGTSGHKMLEVAKSSGALLDVINVNEPKDMERLQRLAKS